MESKIEHKETFDQWIERIAEIKPWSPGDGQEDIDVYVSRIDGGYLCFGNLKQDLNWLFQAGITEQLQMKEPDGNVCTIGFNPSTQKWHGWSHRAQYGFGIGSEVKKGHTGYMPVDEADFLEWAINFWTEDDHQDVSGISNVTNERGDLGAQITWVYSDKVPNQAIRGKVADTFMYYPKQWGRGEWKAETLEDAKQMAKDFAESVG